MPITLEELKQRIVKTTPAKILGCPGFRGCCPAHDDHTPSFCAWNGKDGWLHVRCAVCGEDQVLAALGLTPADLRQKQNSDPEPAIYHIYRDAEGQNVLCKVRRKQPGGGKTFYIQSWKDKAWVTGLDHLTPSQKNTLYNLPKVCEAVAAGQTIYINEGEKACDLMTRHGLVSTCQPYGADSKSGSKWNEQYTQLLKDADLVIVADRDPTGEGYARRVAAQVCRSAKSVRVVQSKTENPKDDAYDHFAAGFKAEDFVPRPDLLPRRGLETVRFHAGSFQPVKTEFLVEPYLPRGKCVLLDADGGTGKTSLMVAIAAGLSQGRLPITGRACAPARTLYLHKGEDHNVELGTVFQANGGDFNNIAFYQDDLVLDDAGFGRIEESILDGGFDLVVFDALFYFLTGVMEDTNAALPVLRIMPRLNQMAERTGCTFVNIRHTTKGIIQRQASELGMGSAQFRNSHRGQLVARWHPEDRGLVVVTDEKGSIMVRRGPHFCYRRVGLEVHFVHGIENPFDTLDAPTRIGEAEQFLRGLLTTACVPARDCYEEALRRGISGRTLERAKQSLGVKAKKNGFSNWHWTLMEEVDPFA